MLATITVEPMARHRELLPLVAQWFISEWPTWYGPVGPGDIESDLTAFAASEGVLPIGILGFEDGVPVGAGALKVESIPTHKHLSPWAGAGFVLPERRGRGIGAVLLHALVTKANVLGFSHVYCGTSTSESLLKRAGWSPMEITVHDSKPLTIFRSAA
jgi:GNAT superfamily N-acetyltransferase